MLPERTDALRVRSPPRTIFMIHKRSLLVFVTLMVVKIPGGTKINRESCFF